MQRKIPNSNFQSKPSDAKVFLSEALFDEWIRICRDALPGKAYGLVGGTDLYHPTNFYPCTTNFRNTPEWRPIFESFGDFYKNPDLGFVIAPSEVRGVIQTMAERKESLIGVFHSHRFLYAEPSDLDIGLSADPNMLCYIVSLVDPAVPKYGVFELAAGAYQSIPIVKLKEG